MIKLVYFEDPELVVLCEHNLCCGLGLLLMDRPADLGDAHSSPPTVRLTVATFVNTNDKTSQNQSMFPLKVSDTITLVGLIISK